MAKRTQRDHGGSFRRPHWHLPGRGTELEQVDLQVDCKAAVTVVEVQRLIVQNIDSISQYPEEVVLIVRKTCLDMQKAGCRKNESGSFDRA
jgi:hypothetical protein